MSGSILKKFEKSWEVLGSAGNPSPDGYKYTSLLKTYNSPRRNLLFRDTSHYYLTVNAERAYFVFLKIDVEIMQTLDSNRTMADARETNDYVNKLRTLYGNIARILSRTDLCPSRIYFVKIRNTVCALKNITNECIRRPWLIVVMIYPQLKKLHRSTQDHIGIAKSMLI